MWEKAQRAENVKQKNTIISNSGIRFSQDNALARVGGANRSISKWNTMLKLVSYFIQLEKLSVT